MSIEAAIQRVAVINNVLANPALLLQGSVSTATTGGTAAPAGSGVNTTEEGATASSFADALQQASGGYGTSGMTSGYGTSGLTSGYGTSGLTGAYGVQGAGAGGGSEIGARIVAIAESQAGQAEEPPGSNESPAIATYRSATAGSIPGAPWCAYFASWAAHQAGEPIGSEGQGLGSVSEIWSWAQSTGRAITNGPGVVPKPGDLIVFGDEHVGIVRGVLPNGQIETVEGNYENKVALNVRSPSEPTGYVEMS
ncbi:MAG TPA: CHAP domain-containing protein [Solirubrobacteraceae bacterium]